MNRLSCCWVLLNLLLISVNSHAAHKQQTVSLQLLWKHQFQFAGYYIAQEKGFYTEENLDVDIREYQHGIDIVESVVNDETTFAVGRSSIIVRKAHGAPISALFATFQKSPLMLLTRGDIKKPEDLKGKRLMLTSDALDVVEIQAMLIKAGVTSDDYVQQSHSFQISDLISKKTDVMGAYISNEPYQMLSKNLPFATIHPADYGFDMYNDILFTHSNTVKEKPLLTEKFFRSSIKGWQYAFENIEETAQIIFEKYNSQNRSLDALIYEGKELKKLALLGNNPFGDIDQNRFKEMANIYLISGHLDADYDISEFIYKGNKSLSNNTSSHFAFWQVTIIAIVFISYLLYRNKVTSTRNTQLIIIAERDQLTELYNRHKLTESLSEYINLSIRYQWSLSCIFIDIDDFKKINDTHGHNIGDTVLKEFAQLLQKKTRRTDIVGRWGGEEFIIILPETNLKTAESIAAKLGKSVASNNFCSQYKVSCSLGVTQYIQEETTEEFIGRADDALYIAKSEGKNRTAVL